VVRGSVVAADIKNGVDVLILYGIGVGPGDPDLVTIGARRVIEEADAVFLPVSAVGRPSVAGEICEAICERRENMHEFWFPMTHDAESRDREIMRGLDDLRGVWESARSVALPVIGDSVLFATASYLYDVWREILPDLELRLMPGISAHSLAASAAGEFLAIGGERLSILPGSSDADGLVESMRASECVALYKPSALGAKLTSIVDSSGPWSRKIRVHRAGLREQKILTGDDASAPTDDYLSILLLWRDR
jgi:precorrin-2/cobalt-factor-2 C20-methyltransferase